MLLLCVFTPTLEKLDHLHFEEFSKFVTKRAQVKNIKFASLLVQKEDLLDKWPSCENFKRCTVILI